MITPDTRLHGKSTDSNEPLSYRLMVKDMIGLLDAHGIETVSAGGYSDGASIALHMALYHPERIKALILTPVDLSAEALTERFWRDLKEQQWKVPKKLDFWWKTRISPTHQELAKIECPTLIIAGENEQYIKHEYFKLWTQLIPHSEMVWISDASHFLVFEKPNEVNQAILSFLSSLRNL